MNSIAKFEDIHLGETMLIVGNGINLGLTPPTDFDFPTIGMNEIHLYKKIYGTFFKPTYYTTIDRTNKAQYGEKIARQFSSIPKFVPWPRMKNWKGKNFYHFGNCTGMLWPKHRGVELWTPKEDMVRKPWAYGNVTHIAIKLAYFMGAKTILIIGMEHKPEEQNNHFYGINTKMSRKQNTQGWFKGYGVLNTKLKEIGVQLLNISEGTFVPEELIPVDDYRNWIKTKEGTNV